MIRIAIAAAGVAVVSLAVIGCGSSADTAAGDGGVIDATFHDTSPDTPDKPDGRAGVDASGDSATGGDASSHVDARGDSGEASSTVDAGQPGYTGFLSIVGNQFVNGPVGGSGVPTQLRGVNLPGTAIFAISGENTGMNASGGNWIYDNNTDLAPTPGVLAAWKPNIVRLGLSEAPVLGYECWDGNGVAHTATTANLNCNGTFLTQLTAQIAQWNQYGMYVMLVVAFSNPGLSAPTGQDVMANQDHTLAAWKVLAGLYGYPNGTALKRNGGTVDDGSVLFELYNEPFLYLGQPWSLLMNGGFNPGTYNSNNPYYPVSPYSSSAATGGTGPNGGFVPGEAFTSSPAGFTGKVHNYYAGTPGYTDTYGPFIHLRQATGTAATGMVLTGSSSGAKVTLKSAAPGWYVAGHNQMIAEIRKTGAQNPVLCSGLQYASDLSQWAANAPVDTTPPAGFAGAWTPQRAAILHSYADVDWISSVAVASGGTGYAVNDKILLPMDESGGPQSNTCWWQPELTVTAVTGAGQITQVSLDSYTGGTPGVSGGNPNQQGSFSGFANMAGGIYLAYSLPTNPVGTYSTTGHGTGAQFNLTFHAAQKTLPTPGLKDADGILKTPGCPVMISETTDHSGTGIVGAPYADVIAKFVDGNGPYNTSGARANITWFAYTPNAGWTGGDKGAECALIDANDEPIPGFGVYVHDWMTNHAP
jgi:hypothetical protein